jgi:hypothetical protein
MSAIAPMFAALRSLSGRLRAAAASRGHCAIAYCSGGARAAAAWLRVALQACSG